MRIVNRKEFLALPAGTLFAKYTPCFFGDMCIKGATVGNNDFSMQPLIMLESPSSGNAFDTLHKAVETGESFNLDLDYLGRDGLFKEDQLFAVWEEKDVKQLIERLQAIPGDKHD